MRKEFIALLIVFLAGCQISGEAVADIDNIPPAISIRNVDVFDTTASIEWITDEPASAFFALGDDVLRFSRDTSFKADLTNLEMGTRYYYDITVCDIENNCNNHRGTFVTITEEEMLLAKQRAENRQSPITGAAVSSVDVDSVRALTLTAIYALLGIIVLAVVARVGYTTIGQLGDPVEKEVKSSIAHAENMIRKEKHDHAYEPYKRARETYIKLSPEKRVKYYDKLMETYSALEHHTKTKEAHQLADKYVAGTITKEEMDKLKELLV